MSCLQITYLNCLSLFIIYELVQIHALMDKASIKFGRKVDAISQGHTSTSGLNFPKSMMLVTSANLRELVSSSWLHCLIRLLDLLNCL